MKSTIAPPSSRTGHMIPMASGSESKTAATRGAAPPSSSSKRSSRTLMRRHYAVAVPLFPEWRNDSLERRGDGARSGCVGVDADVRLWAARVEPPADTDDVGRQRPPWRVRDLREVFGR